MWLNRWGGVLLGAALAGPSVSSLADAGEGSTTHRIVIEKFAFIPAQLTIKPGDRVEWLNRDIAPHTASDVAGDWDTAELAENAVTAITFPEPGTSAYVCAFHPHMRGKIVVLDE